MRFARDRWYSSEGQRQLHQRARQESLGTRKIIGLTLLLLMILVVMQQLSDPRKYEPAFRAIGLSQPVQAIPSVSEIGASRDTEQRTADSTAPSAVQALEHRAIDFGSMLQVGYLAPESSEVDLFMQMWQRLLETAPPEAIHELAVSEFSSIAREPLVATEGAASVLRLSPATLDWLKAAQSRVERWQTEYQSMADASAQTASSSSDIAMGSTFVAQWLAWARLHTIAVSGASSALDQDVRSGLQLALDHRLLSLLRDASPWRPQERPTLARTLQRAMAIIDSKEMHNSAALFAGPLGPLVEVSSLTKQTDVFRGQLVRLRGRAVTQPESMVQDIEGWGRFRYDVVWVRPNDSSQQPVCLYALRAPSGGWPVASSTTSSAADRAPSEKLEPIDIASAPLAEFTGILVKRLAYPSQRGVDVAPVLVALDTRWLSNESPSRMESSMASIARHRTHRWIEPGEQTANLELLREIFASDLESLSDENTQSMLTDTRLTMDIDAEAPQLPQILFQLPRIERPLANAIASRQLIGPARLDTFQGWVRAIEPIRLTRTRSNSGEPAILYRLRLESDADPSSTALKQVAFVNQVPSDWKAAAKIAQPIALAGLYWETSAANGRTRCWIADRVQWSWAWLGHSPPSRAASANDPPTATSRDVSRIDSLLVPPISPDWQLLGAVGFDLNQVDLLRGLRGESITAQESRAFFSILDCADRLEKSGLPFSETSLSAVDCLQEKNPPLLQRVKAKVEIVRATRILVTDEYDQAALGGDAYYELDGLAKLGDLSIQMKSPDGKETLLFQGEFPITLISKQLPGRFVAEDGAKNESSASSKPSDKETVDGMPTLWYPRMAVEVEGIFYRLWSFNTAQTSALSQRTSSAAGEAARLRQIGPLLAVTQWRFPSAVSPPTVSRSMARELSIAVGLAAVCIYVYYRLSQASKRRKA